MKRLLIPLILLSFVLAASAQTTRPFTFFIDPTSLSVPVSTTVTFPACFMYTGGILGSYQAFPEDSYVILRFDAGFGTLNSVSNLRLVNWARGSTPSDPISVSDFNLTIPLPTSNNKIILSYEGSTTKNLAYRRQVCMDIEWTSPATAGSGLLEFNESVIDPAHPTTYELPIFVHN